MSDNSNELWNIIGEAYGDEFRAGPTRKAVNAILAADYSKSRTVSEPKWTKISERVIPGGGGSVEETWERAGDWTGGLLAADQPRSAGWLG